jgi:hypothetical protein
MARRRSKQNAGAKQDALEQCARRDLARQIDAMRRQGVSDCAIEREIKAFEEREFELSKQTPHEQRAWREYELVFNVFAGPRLTLKPDVWARYLAPSGLRQLERREAQLQSHMNHVLVYALDVYCKACGLPLASTRAHARTADVTHTTIARIRGEIRKNPEAYEATRRLYLRHARSGRPVRLKWWLPIGRQ